MGFGNYVPYEPKIPPDPTFGELREDHLGYSITCLKCRHRRFILPREHRFLRERLPDDLKLRAATTLFKCSKCNHNKVRIIAETAREQLHRSRRDWSLWSAHDRTRRPHFGASRKERLQQPVQLDE